MRILVGLGVTMASLVMATTPASAAPTAWGYVRNQATHLCLQYQGYQEAGTDRCEGFPVQTWEWQRSARPEFALLKNQATGDCLDANDHGAVYTRPCDANNVFQWWVRQPDTTIKHGRSGRYLDSDFNGAVYTLPPNGGAHQKWY